MPCTYGAAITTGAAAGCSAARCVWPCALCSLDAGFLLLLLSRQKTQWPSYGSHSHAKWRPGCFKQATAVKNYVVNVGRETYTPAIFLGGVVFRPIVAKRGQTHVSFTERHTHTHTHKTVRKRRASSVLGRFPLPSFFRRNGSGGFAQQSIRLFQAHVEIVF